MKHILKVSMKDLFNFFKEYVSKYKQPIGQSKEKDSVKIHEFFKE